MASFKFKSFESLKNIHYNMPEPYFIASMALLLFCIVENNTNKERAGVSKTLADTVYKYNTCWKKKKNQITQNIQWVNMQGRLSWCLWFIDIGILWESVPFLMEFRGKRPRNEHRQFWNTELVPSLQLSRLLKQTKDSLCGVSSPFDVMSH